ncbi:MAG: hypothetical protein Crog4KO_26520 [Crocinitomicaceae bacterium]
MQIRILHLEDNPADAELIELELAELEPVSILGVASKEAYINALSDGSFDLILSDYNVPDILGLESLELAKVYKKTVPFIYVSGAIGEEGAVEMLKAGATDYVLKSKLKKLPLAIVRAVQAFRDQQLIDEKERKIRLQEQEYRNLIDQMNEGFFKVSETGEITIANPAACELFGYSKLELLGQKAKDILELELYGKHFFSDQNTNTVEMILEKKSCDQFWANLGITAQFGEHGEFQGSSVIVRDISEEQVNRAWSNVLANVTREIRIEENSFEHVFEKLRNEIGSYMPNKNFFVSLRTRDDVAKLVFARDSNTETSNPPVAAGFCDYILKNKTGVWLNGNEISALDKKLGLQLQGVLPKSMMLVPITSNDQVTGAIGCVDYLSPSAFNEFQHQILTRIGKNIGVFLEKLEIQQDRNKILEHSQNLICIAEEDGYLRYTNQAFENNLGYSQDELRELNVLQLIRGNNQKKQSFMSRMLNAKRRKFQFESTINTKQGDVRHIAWTVMAQEKDMSFYCIGHDYTEKRNIQRKIEESEQRYRGLFQRMNEGLLRSDEHGNITTVNPGLLAMLGYTEEELIGKNGYDVFVSESTAERLRKKIKYRRNGKAGLYETTFYHKNGQEVYVQVSATPDYNAEGEFIGVMSIILNVTQQKRAEKEAMEMKERFTRQLEKKVSERTVELENARRELAQSLKTEQQLGKLKSHFVSTASHQFRTPLAVILSNLGILSMYLDDMQSGEELSLKDLYQKFSVIQDRIANQIDNMTNLMNDVLILGKINDGNIQLRMKEQSLTDCCEGVVSNLNSVQGSQQINYQVIGTPRDASFDKQLMDHSISNLLSNARKYAFPTTEPTLKILFTEESINVMVINEGIGIPENEIDYIFDPFYRATNAKSFKGTGLGTSIVKEYLEQMNAKIAVESIPNKNTIFTITLKS